MKHLLRLLLCMLLSLTTASLYSQELTEKEQKRQAEEQAKQEKANAKQERKKKKRAEKEDKDAALRAKYEAFLEAYQPEEATTQSVDAFFEEATKLKQDGVTLDGILKVFNKFFAAADVASGNTAVSTEGQKERFYKRADNIFAIMSVIVKRNQLIEMVPQPYFDEEMGVNDTTWVAMNRNTGEEFAKGDATLIYGVSLAAASGAGLLAAQAAKDFPALLKSLKSSGLAAIAEVPKMVKTGANITMTVRVLPLIVSQIKDNQEKLAYKKANEAQDGDETPADDADAPAAEAPAGDANTE
ncbi:MAG: hypothetical protein LBL97_00905 [Prevotellaceae bacterium]|jgi:hypothetical protein|nr:hypothetical protein [Prevotellaceae bacterium]